MSWESKIEALSVRQLIYIALAIAIIILIWKYWDEIKANFNQ